MADTTFTNGTVVQPDWLNDVNDLTYSATTIGKAVLSSADIAEAQTTLNVPSRTGSNASGTWNISVSGNAATATNATSADNGVPAGTVIFTARSSAPTGYIDANGAAVSRTTYAALFAAIGTLFGAGDGSTTFNLPDLRGVFPRGWDNGRGLDASRVLGSYQADALQNITGGITFHGAGVGTAVSGASGALVVSDMQTNQFHTNAASTGSNSYATVSLNAALVANTATETRPKNLALLACIKY